MSRSSSSAADPRAEGGDDGLDLLVLEHLVEAGLLDVEHLAAQRQDGLVSPVAALLGGAAGGIALDEVELAPGRVLFLAVGQFAGQGADLQGALAPRQLCAPWAASRARAGIEALAHDLLGDRGFSSR